MCFSCNILCFPFEDDQNMPPQNMPLWHKDDFELKNQQTQEEFLALPLSA